MAEPLYYRMRRIRGWVALIVVGCFALSFGGRWVWSTVFDPQSKRDQVIFINNGHVPGTLEVDGQLGYVVQGNNSFTRTIAEGTHTAVMVGFDKKRGAPVTFTVPPRGEHPFRGVVQLGKPLPMVVVRKDAAGASIVQQVPAEAFTALPADTQLLPVNSAFKAGETGVSHLCDASSKKPGGHACPVN